MCGSSGQFPQPPGFSKQETDFLDKQGFTLDQFSQYLSDANIQNKETSGLLKDLSGLYDTTVTKKGTPASKGTRDAFNQKRVDQISGQIDRYKNTVINSASEAEIPQWVKNELARAGYDTSRTMAQHNEHGKGGKDPSEIFKNIASGIKSDESRWGEYGLKGSEEYDTAATPDETELSLNPEKVKSLREKIAKNMEFQDEQNTKINDYASQYLDILTGKTKTPLQAAQERISLLGAERQEKALKGELPVSEGLTQRLSDEYRLAREKSARRGAPIEGETLSMAAATPQTSTAGNELVGQMNRTARLLEDSERHGEIASGAGRTLSYYGAAEDVANRNYGTASGMRGSPYGQLSLLPQSGAPLAGAYGSLMGGYGMAMQPYAQDRQMQYGGLLQGWQNNQQNQAGMYNMYGQGAGALLSALLLRGG